VFGFWRSSIVLVLVIVIVLDPSLLVLVVVLVIDCFPCSRPTTINPAQPAFDRQRSRSKIEHENDNERN
jgi:hypothetical protein